MTEAIKNGDGCQAGEGCGEPIKRSGARGRKAYIDNYKRSFLLLKRADQLNYSDEELLE